MAVHVEAEKFEDTRVIADPMARELQGKALRQGQSMALRQAILGLMEAQLAILDELIVTAPGAPAPPNGGARA